MIQRHHRFLMDVRLDDGRQVTAHSGNTGGMLGCSAPGMRVWLSDSRNSRRKYRLSLELVQPAPGQWVGVNTLLPNRLVREALEAGKIPAFSHYDTIRPEVRFGDESSRVDFLLQGAGYPNCYLEVKNVTYCQQGRALFPDAVTARGTRHLRELMRMREQGHCAALIFCVQHSEAYSFSPAALIDPVYTTQLQKAMDAGVQVQAWKAAISPEAVNLSHQLPVLFSQ